MDEFNIQHPRLMRMSDLNEAGIVMNWPQLGRLIRDQGFPTGYLLSPGCRVWDVAKVEKWLDGRREITTQTRDAAASKS